MYQFRATIEKGRAAANSWCVVRLPPDIAGALKGSPRVTGTIANVPFDGTLISRGGGVKCIIVKRALRDALALVPGQEIDVTLELSDRVIELTLPPELEAALTRHPDAAHMFAQLSLSHRREYVNWVAQAKKPQTREARAQRTLTMVAQRLHV